MAVGREARDHRPIPRARGVVDGPAVDGETPAAPRPHPLPVELNQRRPPLAPEKELRGYQDPRRPGVGRAAFLQAL